MENLLKTTSEVQNEIAWMIFEKSWMSAGEKATSKSSDETPPENIFEDGKISAGGFEIPIGFLSGDGNEEFREMKWEVFNRKIMNMLFLKIGVEPETDEN